jgi:hypothetical protein
MGLSETPSNRKKSLEGHSVGLFVRHPFKQRVSDGIPFEIVIFHNERRIAFASERLISNHS